MMMMMMTVCISYHFWDI